jgi:phosphoribosylamine--glycine ligase
MNVLVVGLGGREHALCWKIRQSPLCKRLFCAPGNPGTATVAENVDIAVEDVAGLVRFATAQKIDLTVIGPEAPLCAGIVDEFQKQKKLCFGPNKQAAEIEGSKAFAREFMERHKIPSPRYEICRSHEEALAFVKKAPFGWPAVVKADGLAGGKGAFVVKDAAEAKKVSAELMADKKFGVAGAKIVIEEFLPGEECSFLVFCDGAKVVPMVSVQDHKRIFDGDQGPNTGGMGTISPATNLSLDVHKLIMHDIVLPTIKGMAEEGRRYQGVLYVGLMITEKGPRVLEFNARFGDPETQVILARMRSDIVPILQGVADGNLKESKVEWAKEPAVCVIVAAKGYPDTPETGKVISGLDGLSAQGDVMVFHAATAAKDGKIVTVGGRVLGVTALAANLDGAVARAYEAVGKIKFDGMHYRKDIGKLALARLHVAK